MYKSIITFVILTTFTITANCLADSTLLGSWRSDSQFGSVSLIFHSNNQLSFDGEKASYTIIKGNIRVSDGYETLDYPYSLNGDILTVFFPYEGYQLQFKRVGKSPKSVKHTPEATPPKKSIKQSTAQSKSKAPKATQIKGGEIDCRNWGFTFQSPSGWNHKKTGQFVLLGHNQIAGMIIVIPHSATTLQQVKQSMKEGMDEEGIIMRLSGGLKQINKRLISGEYSGTWQGQQAKGKGFGTLSPHGGGAMILAVTTPEKYQDKLTTPASQIAKNIQFIKVDSSALMNHFAGYWWHYSGSSGISHEQLIHLGPDGTYRDRREDAANVTNRDQYGDVNSQYLGHSQGGSGGRWSVRGTKYEGVITVTKADGSQFTINYRVKPSQNQKFGDYYFNNTLYGWITEKDLKNMGY